VVVLLLDEVVPEVVEVEVVEGGGGKGRRQRDRGRRARVDIKGSKTTLALFKEDCILIKGEIERNKG
jgi:hypothetical protein